MKKIYFDNQTRYIHVLALVKRDASEYPGDILASLNNVLNPDAYERTVTLVGGHAYHFIGVHPQNVDKVDAIMQSWSASDEVAQYIKSGDLVLCNAESFEELFGANKI